MKCHSHFLDSGSPPSSSSEIHYEVTGCKSYEQLCCKAGKETELLFKPENEKYE